MVNTQGFINDVGLLGEGVNENIILETVFNQPSPEFDTEPLESFSAALQVVMNIIGVLPDGTLKSALTSGDPIRYIFERIPDGQLKAVVYHIMEGKNINSSMQLVKEALLSGGNVYSFMAIRLQSMLSGSDKVQIFYFQRLLLKLLWDYAWGVKKPLDEYIDDYPYYKERVDQLEVQTRSGGGLVSTGFQLRTLKLFQELHSEHEPYVEGQEQQQQQQSQGNCKLFRLMLPQSQQQNEQTEQTPDPDEATVRRAPPGVSPNDVSFLPSTCPRPDSLEEIIITLGDPSFQDFAKQAYDSEEGYVFRLSPHTGKKEMFVAGSRNIRDWVANFFEGYVYNWYYLSIPNPIRDEWTRKLSEVVLMEGVDIVYGHSRAGALIADMVLPPESCVQRVGLDAAMVISQNKGLLNLQENFGLDWVLKAGGLNNETIDLSPNHQHKVWHVSEL